MKLRIDHVPGVCRCVVDADGAIYVRLPCAVEGVQLTKERLRQMRYTLRRKGRC